MLRPDLDDRGFLGRRRIALLRPIGETGSISAAARGMGLSDKWAWDAVDAMNNLAKWPPVERRIGGRQGVGRVLTDAGKRLIAVYETAAREHQRCLARLREAIADFDRFWSLIGAMIKKVSARNNLRKVVTAVKPGAVNAAVTLNINATPRVAMVTNHRVQALGPAPGVEASALIQASFVPLATEDGGLKTSARNRLRGTIEGITHGAVHPEVVLALDGGTRLTAIITIESARELRLAEGGRVCALVKASHVILAVAH